METAGVVYAGVDWAVDNDQVWAMGLDGTLIAERAFKHTPEGLQELVAWLLGHAAGDPASVRVAIEVPHGPIVELLIERGIHVFSINPKQLDRFRDRFTVAGAKDDRLDARVLADSLRTDTHHFRRLAPENPTVIELREVSRVLEDLQQEKTRSVNRLRQQYRRFFPQFLLLNASLDREWVLALAALIPSPDAAKRVRPGQVAKILREHRVRSTNAADVLKLLRQPGFEVAAGTVEAAAWHISLAVERLQVLVKQVKRSAHRLDELTQVLVDTPREPVGDGDDQGQGGEQHDVEILRSLPGVGRIVLAVLLAEASRPLQDRNYHALRALAGAAPVTRRSGRKITVLMRSACNQRLRNATYHWARVASQVDPHWKARYAALRARGHSHGRALRTIADRLLNVACAMLASHTAYDATNLRNAA
jgi:transposase